MTEQSPPPEEEPTEIVEFGLFWPAGDPGQLREAADLWSAMADALDELTGTLGGEVEAVTGGNAGPAIESFGAFWAAAGGSGGAIPATAEQCREMAASLEEFAGAIDEVREEIMQLAIEIAASVAIGVGLAFFTAGLSAGAAAATTARIIHIASRLGVTLGLRAATIAGRVVVVSATAAGEGGVANIIAQTGSAAMFDENHNPLAEFSVGEVFTAAGLSAVIAGPLAGRQAQRYLSGADIAGRPGYRNLVVNQRYGALGEEVSIREISRGGGTVAGRQVSVRTVSGQRPRTDILYRNANGDLVFREVKTGNGRLTRPQRLGYPELRNSGGEVRTDLGPHGLPPGTHLPPTPVEEVRYPR